MPQSTKYIKSVKAITSIKSRDAAGLPYKAHKELDAPVAMLRIWQSERLKKTHADILHSPRYGPACRFFLNDIYAAEDFSRRDNDIEYLYDVMSSVLPNFLLKLVSNTGVLNNLTNELDTELIKVLANDLSSENRLTAELYTDAYRICDNFEKRAHQIDLLVAIGSQVDKATRIPLIGTTLRLARGPAYKAGWGEVHDFLEKGFTSFKKMKGAKKFLSVIKKREMSILERIFQGEKNPF